MNAVRDLENRINRLGRTITVNLRVNEKEAKKASGGGTTLIASNPKAQSTALAAAVASSKALTIADEQRLQINKELSPKLQQQANLLKQIEDQTDKITKNRKEAENIERGFGTKGRLNQLNFGYDALNRKLQRLKAEYKGVTGEVENYKRAADRVNDDEIIRTEKRRKRVNDLRRRRQQAQGLRRAAGAGVGIAATQIPGLGGTASGALAGFAVGGPKGAAVGAAVAGLTELTAALATFGAKSAVVAAEVNKLQLALKNVTGGGNEFKEALAAIRGVVDDFNTPLSDATAQFTKLTAAGKASGFSIQELEQVYRGLSAANKALGGNSERLQGILLATIQVFSKGKVQAEELRGQIGERLAGAFAKFAKSAGLTTSQLDKALEKGEVSLEDFVRFAQSLLEEYEEDAKVIADSPAEAGERLKKAMKDLNVAVGGELASLGAKFQDFATAAIEALQRVLSFLGQTGRQIESFFGGLPADPLERATEGLDRATTNLANANDRLRIAEKNKANFGGTSFDKEIETAKKGIELFTRIQKEQQAIIDSFKLGPFPTTPKPPATVEDLKEKDKKGGRSGRKPRESKVPELQRELALEQELFRLQGLYNQAELKGNEDLQIQIQTRMRLAELAKKELDIRASDIPDNEKLLELLRNQVAVRTAGQEEAQQLALLDKERKETIEGAVRAFNNEVALLGERNEAARELLQIEQDIVELQIQAGGRFTEQQIQAYRAAAQGAAAAREEQRQYNEVLSQVQGPVNALVGGLQDVVAGTKTAEEAFADFLKTVADQLIQTAAVMIAQYIAIGIARAFAGMGGGGGDGFADNPTGTPTNFIGSGLSGFRAIGLADGGFVTSPTPAIVGDGGGEYILPEQDMSGALARYSAGARGDAVINGADPSGASGGGTSLMDSTPITISTGPIMQFEGSNYVSQAEFNAGIKSAAKQGEAAALRKIQMNPGTRRRLGL